MTCCELTVIMNYNVSSIQRHQLSPGSKVSKRFKRPRSPENGKTNIRNWFLKIPRKGRFDIDNDDGQNASCEPKPIPDLFITTADKDKNKTLHVENLILEITQESLRTLFLEVTPGVKNCKILPSTTATKSSESGSQDGVVEFNDRTSAEVALISMNGRVCFGIPIKVSWWTMAETERRELISSQLRQEPPLLPVTNNLTVTTKKDANSNFRIYVGNLDKDTTADKLLEAFSAFGPISSCRVVKDFTPTDRFQNKGFGFVSFVHKLDAETSMKQISGKILGKNMYPIRIEWALNNHNDQNDNMNTFDRVYNQRNENNTTVSCKMIFGDITRHKIYSLFSKFGKIVAINIDYTKRCALIKYADKKMATQAIISRDPKQINDRPVTIEWSPSLVAKVQSNDLRVSVSNKDTNFHNDRTNDSNSPINSNRIQTWHPPTSLWDHSKREIFHNTFQKVFNFTAETRRQGQDEAICIDTWDRFYPPPGTPWWQNLEFQKRCQEHGKIFRSNQTQNLNLMSAAQVSDFSFRCTQNSSSSSEPD